jgi:hypothetical protein
MRKPEPRSRPTSSSIFGAILAAQSAEEPHTPQTAAGWQTTPSTVLIGRDGQLIPQNEKQWAIDNLEDVCLLDNDHFIIFRTPEAVSRTVLEALPAS